MPRGHVISPLLTALVLAAFPLGAQVWPETWREHKRVKAEPVAVEDQALFAEFGGEAAESALYQGPAGKFRAKAWRLKDSTGALAWFQALRPAEAVPVRNQPLAATTPGSLWLAEKNYVLSFDGWRPTAAELTALYPLLPKMHSGGGLAVFLGKLPVQGRIRNSERYILGLTSLDRFEKRIPGFLAGFEDGGEIALARYAEQGGEFNIALFNYPTQQVASQHASLFMNQPGWVVARSGPYVTVALSPADSSHARQVIESVIYNANFTWNQATKALPIPPVGSMLLAIFQLTGVLLLTCVGGGVLFAWLWKALRRRDLLALGSESPMTFLHIPEE